ncbi:hypothetical protein GE09DRAFT_1290009 [Coniochaeta sp. 2T2.1]|nr:hypothetical protein GE09DRAFT_1290009 [Coniochaeta sp. 2T2.1]
MRGILTVTISSARNLSTYFSEASQSIYFDDAEFDVSRPSELTVYLFEKHYAVTASLGFVRLAPFLLIESPGEHWVEVEDGNGRIGLEISYLEKNIPGLGDTYVWDIHQEVRQGDLLRVEKRDTNRTFLMKTVSMPDAETVAESGAAESLPSMVQVEHPFIAPVAYAFVSAEEEGHRIVQEDAEIPPPELVLGQGVSTTADWWSFGVVLFEMLIGTPPFYRFDSGIRKRLIVERPLHVPDRLTLQARDIFDEVKHHQFFQDVDWLDLERSKHEVLFEPTEAATVLRLRPDVFDKRQYRETGLQPVTDDRVLENEISWEVLRLRFWYPVEAKEEERVPFEHKDDNRGSRWDPISQQFSFDNHLTGESRGVGTIQSDRGYIPRSQPDDEPAARIPIPSPDHILNYPFNLNDTTIPRVEPAVRPNPAIIDINNARVVYLTPHEWAYLLVKLLLAYGADVDAPYQNLDVPEKGMPWDEPPAPIQFTCGRAVQLAMEPAFEEVVDLLVTGGADVTI